MGMMGVFKWLRKDIIQRDRSRRSHLASKLSDLNSSMSLMSSLTTSSLKSTLSSMEFDGDQGFYEKSYKTKSLKGRTIFITTAVHLGRREPSRSEAYRNALQAFLDRRKKPINDERFIKSVTNKTSDVLMKNEKNQWQDKNLTINYEIPQAEAMEISEIGWIAGTEDRYLELISAEWQNTKVSLKRHTHPECKNAIKNDIKILTKIHHPNVFLLMGLTLTDDHGLVGIFEAVDCTLYNFIHEQGERISVQSIVKYLSNLSEALKYAHSRGYIHSAISSHSVLFTTGGIVKLGGWELATDVNQTRSTYDYEERLRSEIFRWQAPELFTGHKVTNHTDVYGLTLLMWEMCTMNIPWNGLTIDQVEKHYVELKQGLLIETYNFPPLLNNLLESGLKVDLSKRTIDMIKMSKFLQRLESHYNNESLIFLDELINNNNNYIKQRADALSSRKFANSFSVSRSAPISTRKHLSTNRSIHHSESRLIDKDDIHSLQKLKSIKKTISSTSSCNRSTSSCSIRSNKSILDQRKPVKSDFDETDPRVDIKKLKENLADKRKHFFGDNNLPLNLQREMMKNKLLSEIKSKNYQPHKPASHKTSLQPNQVQLFSEYIPFVKSTSQNNNTNNNTNNNNNNKTSTYSSMPKPIRNAVIQPQILNSDSRSFFESSLWKKEKLICLSKMRRSNSQDNISCTRNCNQYINIQDNISPTETYTIDEDENDNKQSVNNHTFVSRTRSLQTLKDALERATDILSSHPNTPDSFISNSEMEKVQMNQENGATVHDTLTKERYELNNNMISDKETSSSGGTYTVKAQKPLEPNSNGKEECYCSDKEEDTEMNPTTLIYKPKMHQSDDTDKNDCDWREETSATSKAANSDLGSERYYSVFVCGDKTEDDGCYAHPPVELTRRRSLPAGLDKLNSYQMIKPVIKSNNPDNTTEDLYIDDGFGENNLAPNMMLFNEDTLTDIEDIFELLDLKSSSTDKLNLQFKQNKST